jgi:hypothetical protein
MTLLTRGAKKQKLKKRKMRRGARKMREEERTTEEGAIRIVDSFYESLTIT